MSVCAQCGTVNAAVARFCHACGTPLPQTELAVPAEERKIVSVLFCDLVGFTAASDNADPEDVRALLRPYHAMLRTEIERFGGTVEKFIGDAVMAVFGAPVAHEDDAERAVRAGLSILAAIEDSNRRSALDLAVRIAVATGEAVVTLSARPSEGEGFVTGDVVNTASRLQGVAPVGGLAVAEATWLATRRAVEYAELPPVTVKGKAVPIAIWQAVRVRSETGDHGALRTPFVGRVDELEVLRRTFTRAVREESVQLVTVMGEPGSGKSRLVGEFATHAAALEENVSWLLGRCLPYGEGLTFWALSEIVRSHAGITEADSPEEASAKLDRAVAEIAADSSERAWLSAAIAPLAGAGGDVPRNPAAVERSESFAAWRRFFDGVAGSRPLVLVFEDLHWADPPLLDFIDELVSWAEPVPMVVVATARPELYTLAPDWGGGHRNSTSIRLSPLSDADTAEMVSSLLQQAFLPPTMQRVLLERAGGNPLYTEEFVKVLLDRAVQAGRLPDAGNADMPLPVTVQALIAARLDTLRPEHKRLLYDAAILGESFWSGALAALGGVPEAQVLDGLRELARKDFVRSTRGSSLPGQAEYTFWHGLVRDVAYAQIPRRSRAARHEAAARWIAKTAADRVADRAGLIAYHYGQALDLAKATGDDALGERLLTPARRFLVLAGDRAMRLDMAAAEAHYRRALDLTVSDSHDRAAVEAKLADVARFAGRPAEAEELYRRAIARFRQDGDVQQTCEVLARSANLLRDLGKPDDARAFIREAVEMLEQQPPGPALAYAYAQYAYDLFVTGSHREALSYTERALSLAETFDATDVTSFALQFRGFARMSLGEPGVLDDMQAAVDVAAERGLARGLVVAYNNLGNTQWYLVGPDASLTSCRAGLELTERRGATADGLTLRGTMIGPQYDIGEWDEALTSAADIVAEARASGLLYDEATVAPYAALITLRRGDVAAARAMVEPYLPVVRQIVDIELLTMVMTVAALVASAAGEHEAAAGYIAELVEPVANYGPYAVRAHLADITRVCVAADRRDLLMRLMEQPAVPYRRQLAAWATAEAVLAEADDDHERAAAAYAAVADDWNRYGHRLEHAQTLLGAGRCAVRLGRRRAAAGQLAAAREVFAALRVPGLQAEAQALIDSAGVTIDLGAGAASEPAV